MISWSEKRPIHKLLSVKTHMYSSTGLKKDEYKKWIFKLKDKKSLI